MAEKSGKSGKLRPMIANLEDIPPVACAYG